MTKDLTPISDKVGDVAEAARGGSAQSLGENDMVANLKAVTQETSEVYILSSDEYHDSVIKVLQIQGLCELLRNHTALEHRAERFCLEQDGGFLTGVKLIERLAGEVADVLDKPGVDLEGRNAS